MPENSKTKVARIFDELADMKDRLTRVECHEESEQKKLDELSGKIDVITCELHEIIGKDAVRSSVSGVISGTIGSIVSGILVWVFTSCRGS